MNVERRQFDMTANHLAWAQEHDWFRDYAWVGGRLVVYTNDGSTFTEYAQLRAWAGY